MDFKAVRQEMTEQALLIEEALKRRPRISLVELADVCDLSPAQAGFIMEQMKVFNMVYQVAFGRFSLTPEYRKTLN